MQTLLRRAAPSTKELERWPVLPETEISEEARRLDRLFPGWYEQVDVEILDQNDFYCCVLGQSVRWDHGYASVWRDAQQNVPLHEGAYTDSCFNDAWIAEVLARKA